MIIKSRYQSSPSILQGVPQHAEPPYEACSRLMLYSHDTYGLGHWRRSQKIATAFRQAFPQLHVLIVTGSPVAECFDLAPGIDYVQIPPVVKVGEDDYAPRAANTSFEATFRQREKLIYQTAERYHPDLLLVDHAPIGMKGELLPTLAALKKSGSSMLAVGLRDIIDEPAAVQRAWENQGIYDVLDEIYDRIFIYGTRSFFDPVSAYSFSSTAATKTTFTGFITPEILPTSPRPAPNGETGRHVLLMFGGGDDGEAILTSYLDMASCFMDRVDFTTTVLMGPLFPKYAGERLSQRARSLGVNVLNFVRDPLPLMEQADLVVSMGGYNSITEILVAASKALIIPRTTPRQEQLIRAQRLNELGIVDYLLPECVTPGALYARISTLLGGDAKPVSLARASGALPTNGLLTLRDLCAPLLRLQSSHTSVRRFA